MADFVKVAVHTSKGIMVHAKGHPAKVVGFGAAAAVVFLAVALGYGGLRGNEVSH